MTRIPVAVVKERADAGEIVEKYVGGSIRKGSTEWAMSCPLPNDHTDDRPSFHFNVESGKYHCKGCGEHGDIIDFVGEMEGLSFQETLALLAEMYGLEEEEEGEGAKKRRRLKSIVEEAHRFYQSALQSDRGKEARKYLSRREIGQEAIETFGIGYAPWEGLRRHLRKRGYDDFDMKEVGLITEGKGDETVDFLRNRVIFPIRTVSGKTVAFAGRAIGEKSKIKYINSPDTPLYTKGEHLFGLDVARTAIRKRNQAIVVEGYTDVIALWEEGVQHSVAGCGTSLTEEQVETLSRRCDEVVLLYDGDKAGWRAAVRATRIVLKHGREASVVEIEDEEDPDAFARKYGETGVEQLLTERIGAVEALVEDGRRRGDWDGPHGRATVIREVIQCVSEIGDRLKETEYAKEIVDVTQASGIAVLQELAEERGEEFSRREAERVFREWEDKEQEAEEDAQTENRGWEKKDDRRPEKEENIEAENTDAERIEAEKGGSTSASRTSDGKLSEQKREPEKTEEGTLQADPPSRGEEKIDGQDSLNDRREHGSEKGPAEIEGADNGSVDERRRGRADRAKKRPATQAVAGQGRKRRPNDREERGGDTAKTEGSSEENEKGEDTERIQQAFNRDIVQAAPELPIDKAEASSLQHLFPVERGMSEHEKRAVEAAGDTGGKLPEVDLWKVNEGGHTKEEYGLREEGVTESKNTARRKNTPPSTNTMPIEKRQKEGEDEESLQGRIPGEESAEEGSPQEGNPHDRRPEGSTSGRATPDENRPIDEAGASRRDDADEGDRISGGQRREEKREDEVQAWIEAPENVAEKVIILIVCRLGVATVRKVKSELEVEDLSEVGRQVMREIYEAEDEGRISIGHVDAEEIGETAERVVTRLRKEGEQRLREQADISVREDETAIEQCMDAIARRAINRKKDELEERMSEAMDEGATSEVMRLMKEIRAIEDEIATSGK